MLDNSAFFPTLEELEKLLRELVMFVEKMKTINLTLTDVFENFMILVESINDLGLPENRLKDILDLINSAFDLFYSLDPDYAERFYCILPMLNNTYVSSLTGLLSI